MKYLQQNYIKYGLLMCAGLFVCLALMHLNGQTATFDQKGPIGFVFVLYPFVIWFLGIKAKKKELKGKMTFKQGWMEGIKTSLVFSIVSPFIFVTYYLGFNPDIISYVGETYQLGDASKETIILVDVVGQFVSTMVMGTIYSAIVAFFLKSKPKK